MKKLFPFWLLLQGGCCSIMFLPPYSDIIFMRKIVAFVLVGVFILVSCDDGDMEKTLINPVTVTFDTDGGTYIAPMTVEGATDIKLPSPKKDGYEFMGWYMIEYGNKHLLLKTDKTYQAGFDVTLYAIFIAWYPVEVSNVSSTAEKIERLYDSFYRCSIIWDNPVDDNFSHIAMAWGELDLDPTELEPGVNTFAFSTPENVFEANRIRYIKCVDKNGNQSKGIRHSIQ